MTIDHAKMLSELLAVIHGDNGHFEYGQGTSVAVEVALEIVVGLKAKATRWIEVLDGVKTVADEAFGPFPVQTPEEALSAIEKGIFEQRQRITELERAEAASGPDERMLAVVEAAKAWCARRNEADAPTMLSILRDAVQEMPR